MPHEPLCDLIEAQRMPRTRVTIECSALGAFSSEQLQRLQIEVLLDLRAAIYERNRLLSDLLAYAVDAAS